jgi:hypothetical protein
MHTLHGDERGVAAMSVVRLLSDLRRAGVIPALDEAGPVFRGNVAALTADQKATISAQKPEVAAILRLEAGQPNPADFHLWKAIYAEVGFWPPSMQALYFERAEVLQGRLGSPEAAEIQVFRELREAAVSASPAAFLRERLGLGIEDFAALCRQCIDRPAPSTDDEDARVAAEILGVYGSRT